MNDLLTPHQQAVAQRIQAQPLGAEPVVKDQLETFWNSLCLAQRQRDAALSQLEEAQTEIRRLRRLLADEFSR